MSDVYTDITNGNDSTGDGSAGTPYQTIQKAFDNANGGDTIWIGDSATNTLASQLNWTSFGGVQDTSLDNRLCVRGWDYSSGAGVDGVAVIDGNSLAGILAAIKNYVTWYHLKITGTDGASHFAIQGGVANVFCELEVYTITGAGSYAVLASSNYNHVINCTVRDVVNGIYGLTVIGCLVSNHSGIGIQLLIAGKASGNTTISGGGIGIAPNGDSTVIQNNTIIGDGTTASIYGVSISSAREGTVVLSNKITGWSGGSNVGVSNAAGNAIAMLGNNHYIDNTLDETASISDDVDIYLSSAGAGPGFVSSGGGASAASVADAVLEELIASHSSVSGSLAERMTRIPDVAPAANGGLPTVDANNRIAGIAGTVINTLDEVAGSSYVEGTHALDQTASTTDVATAQYTTLAATTIATLASQTSFTLTAGSADDDAYNDMLIVFEDASTAVQKAVGTVSDYTGGTKTVTLSAAPAFTIAPSDNVRILASGSAEAAPTVVAIRQEMDSNSTELAKIGTTVALDSGAATIGGMLTKLADDNDGASYDAGTDSQEKLASDVYWAIVDLRRDTANDEYTLLWMNKNAVVPSGSISAPKLQVVKRANGTDLIAETALTQVGSTDYYKLNESSNRLTLGEAAIAIATATIGGATRTWPVIVGRDVS